MIELKQAVETAIKYFEELNVFNSASVDISNVLLEEVFKKEYHGIIDCWFITLGYNEIVKDGNNGKGILSSIYGSQRKYKTIIIDPEGNVCAMKVREAEYA